MDFKDYYATLGVARDATADEIKKAFRKLARKYHPDVSKEPDAEARMQAINEANTVLSDPEKRAAYDQLGQGFSAGQEFRPPPGWDDGFEFSGRGPSGTDSAEFSDFFARIFGHMGHDAPRRHGRGGRLHGEDHHARVALAVEDAFLGATRQISLRVPQVDAEGRVALATRTLNVQIPKGVCEGQLIRLAGQGGPGSGGAPAGDLLLEVHFHPHPDLRVEGRDIHRTLAVAPWEAALGAVVPVTLPDGTRLNVRIPEGARNGGQLRLRGRGIPSAPPGDMLLDLSIVLPPATNPKARALYETMARDLDFDPRATTDA